jgi:hypothetical protein
MTSQPASLYAETDARHHTPHVKEMLDDLIEHLRADLEKVEQPKAQALFETAAEVLIGLRTAFDHYERGAEQALVEAPVKM